MNNKKEWVLPLAIGAAIGALLGWLFTSGKHKDIADAAKQAAGKVKDSFDEVFKKN